MQDGPTWDGKHESAGSEVIFSTNQDAKVTDSKTSAEKDTLQLLHGTQFHLAVDAVDAVVAGPGWFRPFAAGLGLASRMSGLTGGEEVHFDQVLRLG